MKILIAEDDLVSRKMMLKMLSRYGDCHLAEDGAEALEQFRAALGDGEPYDLVFLDMMMPNMGGQEVLDGIREAEEASGFGEDDAARVVMTTALDDSRHVVDAFNSRCDGYLVKPVDPARMNDQLSSLGILSES